MLSVCLANEMQPITLQASLAANQMEMGKLRDDDGVWGTALILHFVNVKESWHVHERVYSYERTALFQSLSSLLLPCCCNINDECVSVDVSRFE